MNKAARAGVICTANGIPFDLLHPNLSFIKIEDIAYGLAGKQRFGAHCRPRYSVARHSIEVARWLQDIDQPRDICLAGLLHDAAEAYTTDMPTPAKVLFDHYREIEDAVQAAIYRHFGLDPTWAINKPAKIVDADNEQYMVERRHLMPDVDWWANPHDSDCDRPMRLSFPEADERDFLSAFKSLEQ